MVMVMVKAEIEDASDEARKSGAGALEEGEQGLGLTGY